MVEVITTSYTYNTIFTLVGRHTEGVVVLCQSSVLERQDARAIYRIPKVGRKGMYIVSSTTRDVDLAGLIEPMAPLTTAAQNTGRYAPSRRLGLVWFGLVQLLILHCSAT